VRDPYTVYPSTLNLWKTLYETHGMQKPTFAGLEEQVFRTFSHMYERLEKAKGLIPSGRFHEMKYEELTRAPVDEMNKLYDALELGGFEQMRPRLEDYFRSRADYRANRYPTLAPELHAEITRRWGDVIQRYGYGPA